MRKSNKFLFKNYMEALLDLIYPPNITCILCNNYLEEKKEYSICCKCIKEISFITENYCQKCSKPLTSEGEIDICRDCQKTDYYFHRGIAVVEYREGIKELMFRFKYYDATYLARDMAFMMSAAIKGEAIEVDMLMAVPLHPQKERKRGYNQSHLLAKHISRNLEIDYQKNNLIRVKDTRVMHNLSREQRRANLEDAFQIKDIQAIEGKNVLLVDDIFTTGATANSCSKVLMEGGAKSVTVLTFARGV